MIRNIEAEQAVLGAIFLEPTVFEELKLQATHFVDPRHIKIYKAMSEVASKDEDIDFVKVTSALGDGINDAGGTTYLLDLANSSPSAASSKYYEQLVFDAYKSRAAQHYALKFSEEPGVERLDNFMTSLQQLSEEGTIKQKKSTRDMLLEIAESMMDPEQTESTGCPTGFRDFDEMTGGPQKGELSIIAARPSMGKTAFALNIGSGHCKKQGTSHIFSLEMGAKELLFRVISSEANINGMKWRSMLFSESDYNNGMQAIGDISNWGLEIHEDITTIEEIKRTLTQAVKENPEGDHLAIIDYLQLIKTTKKYDRRDLEVGDIARELKLLAKKLNIPVILLSQLSRGVEQRQDKRPVNSDLRDSGNIEEHADLVGFLYRDDYYDSQSEKQNIIEIILSKQRNGPIGTVELAFIKEYGKFVNLDHRYDQEEVPV